MLTYPTTVALMTVATMQDLIEDNGWLDESEEEEDNSHPVVSAPLKYLLSFIVIWQFAYTISNAALSNLLRFLKFFVVYIGRVFQCKPILDIGGGIPLTLKSVHKLVSLEVGDITNYVVCPSCDSIYEYNDCFTVKANGEKVSEHCKHVHYPDHPHASRRNPCGALLLKKIRTKAGYVLRPIKVYPYKSVKDSIQHLVKRQGFLADCEKWRNRVVPDGFVCDIYDGLIWKQFSVNNFLSSPYCFLLTMNVDWFEPFERGVYSVGVIYLTVQNLPRDERYKPENIIIVGILPGPKEPKLTINSYLTPLVLELNEAWKNGLHVSTNTGVFICVKLALSCVTCDIPASRKVCGFLGHNATLACNKCLKKFDVNFGQPTDYSGYDRDKWIFRSRDQHLHSVKRAQKEITKTGRQSAESELGVRYSVLLALPYFDPIKFVAIDAMHNLFLGSGKHTFEVWIDKQILTKEKLLDIESKLKLFHVPVGVGRVPSRISSCYGTFTANQWKNWITVYSPVLLKDILPSDHMNCWLLFVRACSILCSYCIKQTEVMSADLFLGMYCQKFQELYGNMSCSFNMHLHLHLKQTFLDFGPPHASWCFAFERYNGILGSYHTNNREIESQIMKKFCQNQAVHGLSIPLDADFRATLPESYEHKFKEGTLVDSLCLLHMARDPLSTIASFAWKRKDVVRPLPPSYEHVLDNETVQMLENVYKQLYPSCNIIHVPRFYQKFGRLLIAGDLIGSDMRGPNARSSSVIMAFWPDRGSTLNNIDSSKMHVGVVQYFMQHELSYRADTATDINKEEHIFAYVRWKELHPCYDFYGVSATVCIDMFHASSCCCFLPVQRIACRCAHVIMPVNLNSVTETVFIACPVPLKYSL